MKSIVSPSKIVTLIVIWLVSVSAFSDGNIHSVKCNILNEDYSLSESSFVVQFYNRTSIDENITSRRSFNKITDIKNYLFLSSPGIDVHNFDQDDSIMNSVKKRSGFETSTDYENSYEIMAIGVQLQGSDTDHYEQLNIDSEFNFNAEIPSQEEILSILSVWQKIWLSEEKKKRLIEEYLFKKGSVGKITYHYNESKRVTVELIQCKSQSNNNTFIFGANH